MLFDHPGRLFSEMSSQVRQQCIAQQSAGQNAVGESNLVYLKGSGSKDYKLSRKRGRRGDRGRHSCKGIVVELLLYPGSFIRAETRQRHFAAGARYVVKNQGAQCRSYGSSQNDQDNIEGALAGKKQHDYIGASDQRCPCRINKSNSQKARNAPEQKKSVQALQQTKPFLSVPMTLYSSLTLAGS